jgi:hypothetical protein
VVLPAVPEQMPAACKVAAEQPVVEPEQMLAGCRVVAVPELTPAACKAVAALKAAEPVRRAVDPLAALRVAVECKAAVLTAAALPVEPAQMVAAVFRRPGAEPLAVAARKAVAPKVLKAAVVVAAAR